MYHVTLPVCCSLYNIVTILILVQDRKLSLGNDTWYVEKNNKLITFIFAYTGPAICFYVPVMSMVGGHIVLALAMCVCICLCVCLCETFRVLLITLLNMMQFRAQMILI